jgi:small-conductance mechanosensitive channel
MEKQKATSILNDIMEKLSLIKKDDVKEVELKEEEVQLSEQLTEEEEISQELTELACQEEVVAEELSSDEVEAEKLEEEAPVEEVSEESLNEDKYVSREEFDMKIKAIMDKIDEMKLGYDKEKVSMSKQIEELSKEPAAEPISQGTEEQPRKKVLYSQNRQFSTKDRVLNQIFNINR